MCTVTFISVEGRVFITSNRDESPGRQAKGLYAYDGAGTVTVHYPIDETSQGSWIAMTDSGRAICLLNGAFEPFIPHPPYRVSRGQVVLSAATAAEIPIFLEQFNLSGIAPFTLLIYEGKSLVELIWDGADRFIRELSVDIPRLWSSVTLYPPDVRQWRDDFFKQWLTDHPVVDRESIIAFHQVRRGDDQHDLIMNRNEIVKTLSVTSILLQPASGSMLHLDLEKNTREEVLVRYGE